MGVFQLRVVVGWTTEVSFLLLLSSCEYDTLFLATSKKNMGCVDSVSGHCA